MYENLIEIAAYSDLLDAAGSCNELSSIPADILTASGLPEHTTFICEREAGGYAIHIESDVPMSLVMVFIKDGNVLYQGEISEEIPEPGNLVPLDKINGWTEIKFLRNG